MKASFIAIAVIVLAFAERLGYAQGTFVNLGFENPVVPLVPDIEGRVSITNAMPGWGGYIGGSPVDRVLYNTVSIGAAAIDFHGPGSSHPILQGDYMVGMGPSSIGPPVTAAIGQTGTVPGWAKSLTFDVYPSSVFSVTFGGEQIPTVALGSTPTTAIFGGDVSAFANLTAELRFQGGGWLDNIQFSNQPIPEPSMFGLFALGALLLGWRLVRQKSRIHLME